MTGLHRGGCDWGGTGEPSTLCPLWSPEDAPIPLDILFVFFLLKHSHFTILFELQMYTKGTQLYYI